MIMRQLFRIEPVAPPTAFKTYGGSMPVATHWRDATCQEVECDNYARGFQVTADVSTELGRKQANYIRLHSGRHFTATQLADLVTFTFPAGQVCFAKHRVQLERMPRLYVRGGDHRSDLGTRRRVLTPQQWTEDFGEHQLTV